MCELVYQGIQNNQTTDVEVNGYVAEDSSACGDDTISYASHPGHERTELGKALYSKGWNNTGLADVWSNVLVEHNSCYAYPVELSSGIVSGYGGERNKYNRMYAICR